jgi:hypothetical protein
MGLNFRGLILMGLAFNFISFQIGWFACVIGAAKGYPLLATAVASLIIVLHLCRVNNVYSELSLIISAVVIGIIWESLLVASDWLSYSNSIDAFFAPIWLVAMWALFATTINVSMAWLKNRWLLASSMGAIFGPLAFIAGEKLGAVQFIDRSLALLALAVGWACLMPMLLWLADLFKCRFDLVEK